MAVVWAKNNGNWSDTTLWAFWNETTQQIEDYGHVPQVDDVVYCNGFEIRISGTTTAKIITNELNQYTNISGGHIRADAGYTVNADLVAYGEQIYYTFTNATISTIINGNIIIKGNTVVFGVNANAQGRYFTINGNIINEGCNLLYSVFSIGNRAGNLTINGNVIIPNMRLRDAYTATGNYSIFINGDLECECIMGIGNTEHINTTVSGTTIVNNIDTSLITTNKIHYRNSFNLTLANITPIDAATFECKYIGSLPNPNPYIIVNPNTIADTYPTEDKVLAPTQYGAQMELVGQYTPNYPPESVVLKDYEYGDSDDRKTGTMPVLSQQLISRLENCATVETVQQLLVAHLDN